MQIDEAYNDPSLQAYSQTYQQQNFGQQVFRNGVLIPLGAAFIQETTIFREFGPLAGNTMRLAYDVSPPIGGVLSRQTFDADARHYLRIGTTGLLATRIRGVQEHRRLPRLHLLRRQLGNARLRLPAVLRTERRVRERGTALPADRSGADARSASSAAFAASSSPTSAAAGSTARRPAVAANGCGDPDATFKFFANNTMVCTPVIGNVTDAAGFPVPNPLDPSVPLIKYGNPTTVTGFRLQDARASYGIGLETFALGFPIHFDWSWRTLFNRPGKTWSSPGSAAARRSASRASRSGLATTSERSLRSASAESVNRFRDLELARGCRERASLKACATSVDR